MNTEEGRELTVMREGWGSQGGYFLSLPREQYIDHDVRKTQKE